VTTDSRPLSVWPGTPAQNLIRNTPRATRSLTRFSRPAGRRNRRQLHLDAPSSAEGAIDRLNDAAYPYDTPHAVHRKQRDRRFLMQRCSTALGINVAVDVTHTHIQRSVAPAPMQVAVKSARYYLCHAAGTPMSSIVPSFSLSRLRPTFGLAWHWINRPSYHVKVRHQFELGGFEVEDAPSIDLDPMGLQWMRTMELSSRHAGIKYRMVRFDDLDVILPGFPGPSPDMLRKMYGS
jgi:hypothetical protein